MGALCEIEELEDELQEKYKNILDAIIFREWYDADDRVHFDIEYTDRAELAVYIRKNIDLFKSGRTDEFLAVAKKELSSADFTTLVTMLQDAGLEPRY